MTERDRGGYGPWTTSLGGQPGAGLSTFWRRRMMRLASAREGGGGLSRRDWLRLGAAGLAAAAWPTLRPAAGGGPGGIEEEGPKGRIYCFGQLLQLDEGGLNGLLAIDPDSSAWTVRAEMVDGNYRVSPDGKSVVYARLGRPDADGFPEEASLWIRDLDGEGAERKLCDDAGGACWSPDGRRLIVNRFEAKRAADGLQITNRNEMINADGSGRRPLEIPESDQAADWSGDGEWVVAVSTEGGDAGYQLFIMHPDGTGRRRLTDGKGTNVYPRLSPDGTRAVYHHAEGEGADRVSGLRVAEIATGQTREPIRSTDLAEYEQPCWSPDGRRLAVTTFTWQVDEDGQRFVGGREPLLNDYRITVLDADGGNSRRLNLPRTFYLGAPDWR